MGKFLTGAQIARRMDGGGFRFADASGDALWERGQQKANWTVCDAGNLSRIAQAAEKASLAEAVENAKLLREYRTLWEEYASRLVRETLARFEEAHGPCPAAGRARLREIMREYARESRLVIAGGASAWLPYVGDWVRILNADKTEDVAEGLIALREGVRKPIAAACFLREQDILKALRERTRPRGKARKALEAWFAKTNKGA